MYKYIYNAYIVYKYIYTYIPCFIEIELIIKKREDNRGKTET